MMLCSRRTIKYLKMVLRGTKRFTTKVKGRDYFKSNVQIIG